MVTALKIVEQFNESIRHIQSAYELSKLGNIAGAQKELERSSTCVYQSIEWAVKNYLFDIFDPDKDKEDLKIVEGNSFWKKIDLFEKKVSPRVLVSSIDYKIIKNLKQDVRNNPEHSGYTPHYSSLVKVVQEAKKVITNYIDKEAVLCEMPSVHEEELISSDKGWSEFYSSCDSFNKDKNYILIIGPTSGFAPEKLSYLGLLDWSLIIDFNPNTEVDGFYKNAQSYIEARKKLHLFTSEDIVSFSPYNSVYWLAVNGLSGRQSTLTSDFKGWNRKCFEFLNSFIKAFF